MISFRHERTYGCCYDRTYEGAGPKEAETLVTIPLEEIIVTVDKVKGVNSSSTQGQSLIIAEFDWGTDMDIAMLEMRERIDRINPIFLMEWIHPCSQG